MFPLFLALAALPLTAQEAPAPPPAPAATEATQPGLDAAALPICRELLAFIDQLNAIAASDKSVEEKAAAARALKPRAEELRGMIEFVGMPKIRRAALTLGTPDSMQERTAALDTACADKDSSFSKAVNEIGAIIEGQIAADAPPAEVAEAFLNGLRAGAALAQAGTELPVQEQIDRLETLAGDLHAIYPWIEQGGDSKAVADILTASGQMDALTEAHKNLATWLDGDVDEELAQAFFFYLSTAAEVQHELYQKHLPQPPAGDGDGADEAGEDEDYEEDEDLIIQMRPSDKRPEPSAEAHAAARSIVDVSKRILAVLQSDQSDEQKNEALKALKPEAAEVGKAVKGVSMRELERVAGPLIAKEIGDEGEDVLDGALGTAGLGTVMDELACLMRGEPDPSIPIPAEEVAGDVLGIIGEYSALVKDESLSAEAKELAVSKLSDRLVNRLLWMERQEKTDELRALLQEGDKLQQALDAMKAADAAGVPTKGGELNYQRSVFSRMVEQMLLTLGLAEEKETLEPAEILPEE